MSFSKAAQSVPVPLSLVAGLSFVAQPPPPEQKKREATACLQLVNFITYSVGIQVNWPEKRWLQTVEVKLDFLRIVISIEKI